MGWNSTIEKVERVQWLHWLEDLPKLQEFQINRCFKPNDFGDLACVQLHIFSDGSRLGYGPVAFLRFIDVYGRIHCAFAMGKARLAPIR